MKNLTIKMSDEFYNKIVNFLEDECNDIPEGKVNREDVRMLILEGICNKMGIEDSFGKLYCDKQIG